MPGRAAVDLLAQLADEDVDRPVAMRRTASPDPLQQLVPREHAALLPRNAGRDPATLRVDLRVARAFHTLAGSSFVLASNIENLLNRANFEGENGVVTSPLFGEPKRAGTPRRVTFSASVSF